MKTICLSCCVVLLVACGGPGVGDEVDAGVVSPADAGAADPLAGTWSFSGMVGAHPLEFPLVLSRASDGNYVGQLADCRLPLEKVGATTLRTVAVTCSFTEGQLSATRLYGRTPAFGDAITLQFASGGELRLVADVLSASGTVTDAHFPDAPLSYTFSGQRR